MSTFPRFCALLLALLALSTAHAQTNSILYRLPQAARVSLLITDAHGAVVRELLHAAPRPAGPTTDTWDGLNDQGKPVPAGTYAWKLLSTQGLHAEYLLTLGTNPTPAWDTWPGNHGGTCSAQIDADALYVGGGCGEGTPLLVKQSLDGARRFWTIPQWLDPWRSLGCIATDGGTVYLVQDNCDRIYRFEAATGKQLGPFWPVSTNQCTGRMSARNGQLVMTTRRGVAWLDPATGKVRDEIALPAVRDVKIDRAGRVLAIAGGAVVALTREQPAPQVVIAADKLDSPFRLAIDPQNDEVWVAENSHPILDNNLPPRPAGSTGGGQVKRFSAAGKLRRAYGKPGGRPREGLYDPVAGFLGICDLAVDGRGGFVVVEPVCAPRRLAHFNRAGELVREWYGGQQYANFAEADPADPSLVWFDSHWGELIQAKLDYRRKTWRVRATYRFVDAGDGLVGTTYHGGGRWHVRHHAGQTYLLREGNVCVLRVDERQRRLAPLALGQMNIRHYWDAMPATLKRLVGTADKAQTDKNSYLWLDRNGDGQPQPAEMSFSTWTAWWGGIAPDAGFDYYAWDGKQVLRLPVADWTNSVPCYPRWEQHAVAASFPPLEFADNRGPTQLYHSPSGALFAAFNTDAKHAFGATFWGKSVGGNRLLKWDATGKFQWAVGKHSASDGAAPGESHFFWRMIGGVHGCVVAGDVDNSLTSVWDEDGLWVGRLLESPDLKAAPAAAYAVCGENFGGSLYQNPSTGEVLYFGGGVNNTPVYRITGWNQFQRQHGILHVEQTP